MQDISKAVDSIRAKKDAVLKLEQEYEAVKQKVSEYWKVYFELSPRKNALGAKLKAARLELKAEIEKNKDLADLLKSLK